MTIHLPLVDLGPQPARLAVVAGIHGDEPTPLLLVDRFVRALQARELLAGVRVVAAANPPALLSQSRWGPWDHEDMNRVGDRVREPALTLRLARAVVEVVAQARVCVNMHNFVMRTPFLAIHPPGLEGAREERHRRWLSTLDPQLIWCFADAPEDRRTYASSLDARIEESGVDVIAVEMSDLPYAIEADLDRGLRGLLRLAMALGCIAEEALPEDGDPVRVRRLLLRAPGAGVFEPALPLMARVSEGQPLGFLIPLERPGERIAVPATAQGWLMQQQVTGFVRPGNPVAAIGVPALPGSGG